MSSKWRSPDERRIAFETATAPWMKVVLARAVTLTSDRDAAVDLLQETYLKAFRSFDSFETGTNARAWLLTILYSVFVSSWRHAQRMPEEVPLDSVAEQSVDSTPAASSLDPKGWASEEVFAALEKVPPALRAVLLMVDIDEMTYEEVAAAMGTPIGTIRSRLSRARGILGGALESYARSRGFGRPEQ